VFASFLFNLRYWTVPVAVLFGALAGLIGW